MLCPKCNRTNADTAHFCTTCGQPLQASAASSPTIPANLPQNTPPPGHGPQQPYGAPYPPVAGTPQPVHAPSAQTPDNPYGAPQPGSVMPPYAPPAPAALQCRVCGGALTPRDYQCPRCSAPVGTVVNPNDPTASSYFPVGGYAQIENTSGQKGPVPQEVQGSWNWGAAFVGLFWTIAHKVWWMLGIYIALLAVDFAIVLPALLSGDMRAVAVLQGVSFIINLVMIIYLGKNGNRLAWQNRRFESLQQFVEVQGRWRSWGIVFAIFWVIGIVRTFA